MLYLAHRGIWHAGDVENTLSSFDRVVKRLSSLLHGFECDLRQCHLNDPTSWVVFHDANLDRLSKTNGAVLDPKGPVHLNQFQFKGEIPTLLQFCEWVGHLKGCFITINIEIKYGSPEGVRYLLDCLSACNSTCVDWVLSSFDVSILHIVKEHPHGFPMSGLLQSVNDLSRLDAFPSLEFISLRSDKVTPDFCRELKQRNIGLGVYFKDLEGYEIWKQSDSSFEGLTTVFTEDVCFDA